MLEEIKKLRAEIKDLKDSNELPIDISGGRDDYYYSEEDLIKLYYFDLALKKIEERKEMNRQIGLINKKIDEIKNKCNHEFDMTPTELMIQRENLKNYSGHLGFRTCKICGCQVNS